MKTIKIVGISGVGKTTLIEMFIAENPACSTMNYGDYLVRYGDSADKRWASNLMLAQGLVLIADHLEFGDRDFAALYRAEETRGILLLTVTPEELLKRRKQDLTKKRSQEMSGVTAEQMKAEKRARGIAQELCIPLRSLRDATLLDSYRALRELVRNVG